MRRRIGEIDVLLSSCMESDGEVDQLQVMLEEQKKVDQLRIVLEEQKKVLENPTKPAVDKALRSLSKLHRDARRACHRLRREKEKRLRREVERAVEDARSLLTQYQEGTEMSVLCGWRVTRSIGAELDGGATLALREGPSGDGGVEGGGDGGAS